MASVGNGCLFRRTKKKWMLASKSTKCVYQVFKEDKMVVYYHGRRDRWPTAAFLVQTLYKTRKHMCDQYRK